MVIGDFVARLNGGLHTIKLAFAGLLARSGGLSRAKFQDSSLSLSSGIGGANRRSDTVPRSKDHHKNHHQVSLRLK